MQNCKNLNRSNRNSAAIKGVVFEEVWISILNAKVWASISGELLFIKGSVMDALQANLRKSSEEGMEGR